MSKFTPRKRKQVAEGAEPIKVVVNKTLDTEEDLEFMSIKMPLKSICNDSVFIEKVCLMFFVFVFYVFYVFK